MKTVVTSMSAVLFSFFIGAMCENFSPEVIPLENGVQNGENVSLLCFVPEFVRQEEITWIRVTSQNRALLENYSNRCLVNTSSGRGIGSGSGSTSGSGFMPELSGKGMSGSSTSTSGNGIASGHGSGSSSSGSGSGSTSRSGFMPGRGSGSMNGSSSGSTSGNGIASGRGSGSSSSGNGSGSGSTSGSGFMPGRGSGNMSGSSSGSTSGNGIASGHGSGSSSSGSGSGSGSTSGNGIASGRGSGSSSSGSGSGSRSTSGSGIAPGRGSGGSSSGSGSGSGSTSGNGNIPGSVSPRLSTSPFAVIASGIFLNLTMVGFDDAGLYVCRVQREIQSCVSNASMLSVAPLITNVTTSDQLYTLNSTVILTCSALGGPENVFQWFLGDMLVTEELNVSTTSVDGVMSVLTLFNVNASNGGEYSCMVSNAAGNDMNSTTVFISPYFVSQPVDVGGANGSMMIMLVCVAEAFPDPEYQWGRMDGGVIREEIMANSSVLVFDPLLFGDEGNYNCTATSGMVSIPSQSATV